MKNDMSKIYTCELVKELEKREGVDYVIVEPYEEKTIKVEGPAIVLIVID